MQFLLNTVQNLGNSSFVSQIFWNTSEYTKHLLRAAYLFKGILNSDIIDTCSVLGYRYINYVKYLIWTTTTVIREF